MGRRARAVSGNVGLPHAQNNCPEAPRAAPSLTEPRQTAGTPRRVSHLSTSHRKTPEDAEAQSLPKNMGKQSLPGAHRARPSRAQLDAAQDKRPEHERSRARRQSQCTHANRSLECTATPLRRAPPRRVPEETRRGAGVLRARAAPLKPAGSVWGACARVLRRCQIAQALLAA